MATSFQSLSSVSSVAIDPTEGASQVGYREISGDIPSTQERVMLKSWALVFDLPPQAEHHYFLIRDLLDSVTADGLAAAHLKNLRTDRHGSMSQRSDLLGSLSTIWVTASLNDSARGAILVAVNGIVLHVLALPPYEASGHDRAVYVLERIAMEMNPRLEQLRLPAWSDTMSRLPILSDIGDAMQNTSIGVNTYTVKR